MCTLQYGKALDSKKRPVSDCSDTGCNIKVRSRPVAMTLYWNSASVTAVKGATDMDVLKAYLQIESAALGVVQRERNEI